MSQELLKSDESSSDGESYAWQDDLQTYRLQPVVDYRRLSPYLKALKIFDSEDDEEIRNHVLYPTNMSKMDGVVDKLLRKGEENYKRFLEAWSMVTDHKDHEGCEILDRNELLDMVLERYELVKVACRRLQQQLITTKTELEDKGKENYKLQATVEGLKKTLEQCESMGREIRTLRDSLDEQKAENSQLYMRLLDKTDESSRNRERVVAIKMEMDKKESELRKARHAVNWERSASFRLKRKIRDGPSQTYVAGLIKEIEVLKIQLAQSKESAAYMPIEGDIDMRILMLQSDKQEAIQMCSEASEKLNALRQEFNYIEAARDKYLEENEKLRLEIHALSDDCETFRSRREKVWMQLLDVEKEKDQLVQERNEAQLSAQNHLAEKSKYRTEIRKLEESLDKKSLLLREKESLIRDLEKKLEQMNSFRDRSHNIKHFKEYNVKSEFGKATEHDGVDKATDEVFPEIPLAQDYDDECDETSRERLKEKKTVDKSSHEGELRTNILHRQPVVKSPRLHRRTDARPKTSSTDSDQ